MCRKAFTIPDRVFDILVRFEPEVELDVIHAIRAYSKYWDEFETDEGFDYDFSSDIATGVFYSIYDELQSYNQQYFERCQINSENAMAGVVRRKQKVVRRKQKKLSYEKHREAINSKRREKYNAKNRKTELSDEKAKIRQKKAEKMSDESTQSQSRQDVAENSAMADRIIGLNKLPSLHSESLLGKGKCEGKNPSYPQRAVDKPPENNRTSGLSCSKAVPPGCASPGGDSKSSNGNEGIAGNKGNKGSEAIGTAGNSGSCGFGKAVKGSAEGLSAQSAPVPSNRPRELLSAPHVPREGEVRITSDWVIDLEDEYFYAYRRMDPFLKRGVEDWIKENKMGCSIEKRWIGRQICNFAKRQGKLKTLMGVDDDEE